MAMLILHQLFMGKQTPIHTRIQKLTMVSCVVFKFLAHHDDNAEKPGGQAHVTPKKDPTKSTQN